MISKKLFGTLSDGREVDIYELKNANGVSASVITYGATWQSLFAPDRDGNFEDVLIGFDDLKGHVERSDYQGQIVGRYANRICGGHFTVNGKEIDVIKNENGKTCLHGGGSTSTRTKAIRMSHERFVVFMRFSPPPRPSAQWPAADPACCSTFAVSLWVRLA